MFERHCLEKVDGLFCNRSEKSYKSKEKQGGMANIT